jgi:hypothetical protein
VGGPLSSARLLEFPGLLRVNNQAVVADSGRTMGSALDATGQRRCQDNASPDELSRREVLKDMQSHFLQGEPVADTSKEAGDVVGSERTPAVEIGREDEGVGETRASASDDLVLDVVSMLPREEDAHLVDGDPAKSIRLGRLFSQSSDGHHNTPPDLESTRIKVDVRPFQGAQFPRRMPVSAARISSGARPLRSTGFDRIVTIAATTDEAIQGITHNNGPDRPVGEPEPGPDGQRRRAVA